MKKLLTITVCVALIGILTVAFTACNMDCLSKLSKAFDSAQEAVESTDDVDKTEFIENELLTSENDVIMLSTEQVVEEDDLTRYEKVEQALEIFDEIKLKSVSISDKKAELKEQIIDIKAVVKELREKDAELTEEEKALMESYINEIKTIANTLRDTVGDAYKRLHDLRGQYNLGNIDNIVTTFNEVNAVLDTRIECADRLSEVAQDVEEILETKNAETLGSEEILEENPEVTDPEENEVE